MTDKFTKILRSDLLQDGRYKYNRRTGIINDLDAGWQYIVPESLRLYLINHYADEILSGFIVARERE